MSRRTMAICDDRQPSEATGSAVVEPDEENPDVVRRAFGDQRRALPARQASSIRAEVA